MDSQDFQIFTTLRYDPILLTIPTNPYLTHAAFNYTTSSPLYMLDFHRDRLVSAATHWNWQAVITGLSGPSGLSRLSSTITSRIPDPSSPHRVRASMSSSGHITITAAQIPPTSLSNLFPESLPPPGISTTPKEEEFEVLVDDEGLNPSEYSHYKTTKREMYDAARKRKEIELKDRKEVLIIDARGGNGGEVMEGSITTPYFWREGRWVTPSVREDIEGWQGGQDGTTRRWALER